CRRNRNRRQLFRDGRSFVIGDTGHDAVATGAGCGSKDPGSVCLADIGGSGASFGECGALYIAGDYQSGSGRTASSVLCAAAVVVFGADGGSERGLSHSGRGAALWEVG